MPIPTQRRTWLRAAAALCLPVGRLPQVRAAASVMIWPVDPVIEHGQRATALYLENRGAEEVAMQIRVLGWSQTGREENFESQERVIASPPLATIPPGQRQLVRLMSTQPAAEGQETPYRVLVDELPGPQRDARSADDAGNIGVKLQIRYSLPLFVYGRGLVPRQRAREPGAAGVAQPRLAWQVERDGAAYYLRIRNSGAGHARLTNVQWVRDASTIDIHPGLMGYVLPGSEMRWRLSAPPPSGYVPQAVVNAAAAPTPLLTP